MMITQILGIMVAICALTGSASAQEALTNETIIKMVRAGLSEEVVLGAINQHQGSYSLSPEDLIALRTKAFPRK